MKAEDLDPVVFDIDGTLANPRHRLHLIQNKPKRWDEFFSRAEDDLAIPAGLVVANALHHDGYKIEFWTGRPERIRNLTRTWLGQFVGWWSRDCTLRMRQDGDYRPDHIVKGEFWDSAKFKPFIIFEDRTRVVEAFREKGAVVYQVTEGDF